MPAGPEAALLLERRRKQQYAQPIAFIYAQNACNPIVNVPGEGFGEEVGRTSFLGFVPPSKTVKNSASGERGVPVNACVILV